MPITIVKNYIQGNAEDLGKIREADLAIVRLHMNGCGHCVAMAPEWAKFEEKVRSMNSGNDVVIASIEASQMPSIAPFDSVSGYPTILKLNKGNKAGDEFNAPRTADEFLKYSGLKSTGNHPLIHRRLRNSSKHHRLTRHHRLRNMSKHHRMTGHIQNGGRRRSIRRKTRKCKSKRRARISKRTLSHYPFAVTETMGSRF